MNTLKLITLLLLVSHGAFAQKFITKTGHASFFSSAPLEDIEAHNRQVNSIIDLGSGEVAVKMMIQQFKFEKKLMQEHFNENYLESEKYPEATFSGKFTIPENLGAEKNGKFLVKVKGNLKIHGVSQLVEEDATIEIKDGHVKAFTKFIVALEDYKVKIPRIVIKNIAEEVEVTIDLQFDQMPTSSRN